MCILCAIYPCFGSVRVFELCISFWTLEMAQSKEKRKQWREEDMVSAMEAVSQGTAVSTAAKAFNVPRKTLNDRVKGRVKHGTKPGPDTVLTEEEEAALMSYLV